MSDQGDLDRARGSTSRQGSRYATFDGEIATDPFAVVGEDSPKRGAGGNEPSPWSTTQELVAKGGDQGRVAGPAAGPAAGLAGGTPSNAMPDFPSAADQSGAAMVTEPVPIEPPIPTAPAPPGLFGLPVSSAPPASPVQPVQPGLPVSSAPPVPPDLPVSPAPSVPSAQPVSVGPAGAPHPATAGRPREARQDEWAFTPHAEGEPERRPWDPNAPTNIKPGVPSSGNIRVPDWMRDGKGTAPVEPDDGFASGSRMWKVAGIGLLVGVIAVAGGVFLIKGGGEKPSARANDTKTNTRQPAAASTTKSPPEKPLTVFRGPHTKALGSVNDTGSGLSYPQFGRPWQKPAKGGKLAELGFSAQQYVVTEKHGPQLWRGYLMSGTMTAAQRGLYAGPGTERQAATALAEALDKRLYGFRHQRRGLASQALTVGGRRGWLVGSYVRYRMPGIKATGELVVVAVVDTGRDKPGVLFIAVPNTHRKLWPDVNFVLSSLKPAS